MCEKPEKRARRVTSRPVLVHATSSFLTASTFCRLRHDIHDGPQLRPFGNAWTSRNPPAFTSRLCLVLSSRISLRSSARRLPKFVDPSPLARLVAYRAAARHAAALGMSRKHCGMYNVGPLSKSIAKADAVPRFQVWTESNGPQEETDDIASIDITTTTRRRSIGDASCAEPTPWRP